MSSQSTYKINAFYEEVDRLSRYPTVRLLSLEQEGGRGPEMRSTVVNKAMSNVFSHVSQASEGRGIRFGLLIESLNKSLRLENFTEDTYEGGTATYIFELGTVTLCVPPSRGPRSRILLSG